MSAEKQEKDIDLPWQPLVVEHGFYSPLMSGSIDGTDTVPHDRAIRRALKTNYRPTKAVNSDPEKTIFVARLSHITTQEVLHNAFSKYGDISSCHLIRDIGEYEGSHSIRAELYALQELTTPSSLTGRSMGYGFVEFTHSEDAEYAYEECHEMFLDGSKLIVDYECERLLPGWIPRRLGGGLGGKKESGQLRFGGRDRPFRKPIVLGRGPAAHSHSDRRDRTSRDEVRRDFRRYSPRRSREESDRHGNQKRGEPYSSNRIEPRYRHRKADRSRSRSRPRH